MNNNLDYLKISSDHLTGGTSFFGHTVTTTVHDLIQILGEPDYTDGDKTQYEWARFTKDEKCFTIYDWKESYIIEPHTLIGFYIGAHNSFTAHQALTEITEALLITAKSAKSK